MTPATPAATIPSGYLTAEQTAERLGRSIKTLERLVAHGLIKSKLEPRQGRKPERVYEEADVERLRDELERRKERGAAKTTQPSAASTHRVTKLELPAAESVGTLIDLILERVESRRALPAPVEPKTEKERKPVVVPVEHKVWLTWTEASAYAGIPRTHLREMAKEGKIYAQRFGRFERVLRTSVEESAK